MEMKVANKRGYQKEKCIPTDDNVFEELSADMVAMKLIAPKKEKGLCVCLSVYVHACMHAFVCFINFVVNSPNFYSPKCLRT